MAFCEAEFPRKIRFRRVGGQSFSTDIIIAQSGQEQRNRNWANPRAQYVASLVTPAQRADDLLQFVEDVRTFFILIGGPADPFRYYDPLDCMAVNEPMALVSGSTYQLQKTYSRFGRTYVRTITKPITSAVLDYQGNPLASGVTFTGGSSPTIDHTTGQVTFGSASSPSASFLYHIPVRLSSEKFEPEVQESNLNPTGTFDPSDPTTWVKPIIEWNNLGLIEVRPPNY